MTTPLRRAVRTCLLSLPYEENKHKAGTKQTAKLHSPTPTHLTWVLVFMVGQVRYEVWPQPRELLEASCDLGSPLPQLQADFPQLDFSHLPPVWWCVQHSSTAHAPMRGTAREGVTGDGLCRH